jgi:hypothetical protein
VGNINRRVLVYLLICVFLFSFQGPKEPQSWTPVSPEWRLRKMKRPCPPVCNLPMMPPLMGIRIQPGTSGTASGSIRLSPRIKKMKIRTDRGQK